MTDQNAPDMTPVDTKAAVDAIERLADFAMDAIIRDRDLALSSIQAPIAEVSVVGVNQVNIVGVSRAKILAAARKILGGRNLAGPMDVELCAEHIADEILEEKS